MTIGLVLLATLLLICSCGAGVSAYIFRKKLTAMHGMLFAMSLAMGIGLFVGLLIGIIYQGNLLLSTVIGMGAGFMTGIIIGSFYSFLALLEGMLSGMMAGMMGAMLGEMIMPTDWDKTIMIMFTIASSICLLIIFEIFAHVKKQSKLIRIYQNPFIIGPIFVLLCLLLYSQAPFFTEWIPHKSPHH
ncbi:hypothetical protein [Lederbergia citrea]|uniref:hypothetical protein n=1 Tax=Lederbergia citrea TaxID=2833581 RepID=UPI001BC95218|nr:hypothetical protein [Lederbergia citrea]MBS4205047.1 hypothetical protein [Lederbergia citrea]